MGESHDARPKEGGSAKRGGAEGTERGGTQCRKYMKGSRLDGNSVGGERGSERGGTPQREFRGASVGGNVTTGE